MRPPDIDQGSIDKLEYQRQVNEALGQMIIEEREEAHGDYRAQAAMAQKLKDQIRASPGYGGLTFPQKESVDMIAVKISRILNGNPNEPDHWQDIAGYATLVANLLTKGTHL
jgi:hypothetical protein